MGSTMAASAAAIRCCGRPSVSLPNSKLKTHIAEILQKEGYIAGWKVEEARVGSTLTIDLKYGPNRERSIAGIKRVSKPGLRVYAKSTEIPHVLGGLGVAILSTSSGLLTDREATKKGDMWTQEEDAKIIEGVRLHGLKWQLISPELSGRSANAVRNGWAKVVIRSNSVSPR